MIFKVVSNTDTRFHNLSGVELKEFMHDHVKNNEPTEEMHVYKGGYIFKGVDANADIIPWTFSTHDVDRMGDVVIQNGWDLSHYQHNPVILWAHDHSRPAIGLGVDVRLENESLVGGFRPVPKTVDHFGWSIGEKARLGILRAGSVGFMPYEMDFETDDETEEEILYFKRQELLEFSICNVPANPLALQSEQPAEPPQATNVEQAIKAGVDMLFERLGFAGQLGSDHIDRQAPINLPWRKHA